MNFHFRHLLVAWVEVKQDEKEMKRQAALERKLLESLALYTLSTIGKVRLPNYRSLN